SARRWRGAFRRRTLVSRLDLLRRAATIMGALSAMLVACAAQTDANDAAGARASTQAGSTPSEWTASGASVGTGIGGRRGTPASSDVQATGGSGCSSSNAPTVAATLGTYQMSEISGLAASRAHPGVLYAEADSGGAPEIAAYSDSGEFLGAIFLEGAVNVDWEDVAIGVEPESELADYIYIADTGDNNARDGTGARPSIQIYRTREPDPAQLTVESALSTTWEVANYQYPNGANDSEALFVDPQSGNPYLFTKTNDGRCDLYGAPLAAFGQSESWTLEWFAGFSVGIPYESSAQVTAADIAPGGDRILLRTYTSLFLYERKGDWQATFTAPTLELQAPTEPQGEAITFNADASAWFSGSEQSSTIYRGSVTCD
ncbi:MAG TPA: hypothetical protein VIV60_35235, partial [Polyangiaceae bacterium]